MSNTPHNLYKAIHEGKWLSIEYRNKREEITRYWIAVKWIDPGRKTLKVDGLHLCRHSIEEYDLIFIDSIISSVVIEGSYYEVNQKLVDEIDRYPGKYEPIFGTTANLKVLNYLIDCNKLDTQPYQTDYSLIQYLDGESFQRGRYDLSEEQFGEIVYQFQEEAAKRDPQKNYKLKQLCMNVLSIVVNGKGKKKESLYVLAYRRLFLDVKQKVLRPAEDITICKEFTVDGERQSIRKFLPGEEFWMLEHFQEHLEQIKDSITKNNTKIRGVDDRPYMIALGSDIKVDLNKEYEAITKMFEEGNLSDPVKAFFGKIVSHNRRRKDYPIVLLKKQANLDQLLAIHSAMKYPVTYIQGPPGTGKSYTIVNTIITAFFNEQSVLLSSFNNHPIDSVVKSLQTIPYKGRYAIPFPVIRLGNAELVDKTLDYIQKTYEQIRHFKVFESTLEKNHEDKIQRTKQLSVLLERHERWLHLQSQKDAIESLSRSNRHLAFYADLHGRQLPEVVEKIEKIGNIDDAQALALLEDDEEQFRTYLNFTSVKYWKRLGEPKYEELRNILEIQNKEERRKAFDKYISKPENVKAFLRVFPVVATTCISAHKIGAPEPYFDMVIMDEASQCNMALSLVPILRGRKLMLVGDPQQLNPVILLDAKDNEILKQRYLIPDEYDYMKNSIYKAFLANDAVSDELLLRHH